VGKHIEAFKFGELGVHFCRLLIQETVTLLNSHISNIKKEQTQLLSQRQDNKIKDQKKIQQEYNIDAKKRGRKRKRSKSSRSARDSQNSSVSSWDDSISLKIRQTSMDENSLDRMHTFSLKMNSSQDGEIKLQSSKSRASMISKQDSLNDT